MERQSEEQAAQRWAGDGGDLKDRRAPGNGVDKVLLGNEVRNERGAGGPAEGAPCADKKEHPIDRQTRCSPCRAKRKSVEVQKTGAYSRPG